MINKDVFCILYNGLPIEGLSSANGYPIFTAHDKFIPNFSFNTYDMARDALTHMITSSLDNNLDLVDMSKITIGTIKMTCQEFSGISGYDESLTSLMKNTYNTPATLDRYVGKILHLCVRHGFRTILPIRHHDILNNPQFAELFDKHVPFFVQQNIDRFMDVGISTCNPEEIAAIILTSDDELLKAIRIDTLNNVSK